MAASSFTPHKLLESAEGWKEIPPRIVSGRRLFFEKGQRLLSLATDFSSRRDFGWVGHTPCPLAINEETGHIYRHTSESRLWSRDFSRLQTFDSLTGQRLHKIEIPLSRWICWLLERIPGHHTLLGYFAVDRSTSGRVVIDYQIGLIDLESGNLRFASVPFDAVFPLALSFRQNRILFRGWERLTLTDLRGRSAAVLPHRDDTMGRGGCLHPSQPWAVLGGGGLYLWNWQTGTVGRLTEFGQHPLWDTDGQGIWFSRTSSDLWFLPAPGADPICVLRIPRDRLEEICPDRNFALSPDGLYLCHQATWKRVIGVRGKGKGSGSEAGSRQNLETVTERRMTVLNLREKTYWSCDDGGSNLTWF